jgi:fluoride ion exporter CrcB/FEX
MIAEKLVIAGAKLMSVPFGVFTINGIVCIVLGILLATFVPSIPSAIKSVI